MGDATLKISKLIAADDMSAPDESGAKTRIELAFQQLRDGILNGEYSPGAKLRVEQLRQEFGVSASTVREALSRLMAESLVTTEGQRGFRVAEISLDDFRDIADMRKTLEIQAALQSLEDGDDEWEANVVASYHRLSKTEERLDAADGDVDREWAERNQAFHDALIGACGNQWLLRFRQILHGHSNRYIRLALKDNTVPRDVHAEHEAIFNAALARDSQELSELLEQHIGRTVAVVAKKLEAAVEN